MHRRPAVMAACECYVKMVEKALFKFAEVSVWVEASELLKHLVAKIL